MNPPPHHRSVSLAAMGLLGSVVAVGLVLGSIGLLMLLSFPETLGRIPVVARWLAAYHLSVADLQAVPFAGLVTVCAAGCMACATLNFVRLTLPLYLLHPQTLHQPLDHGFTLPGPLMTRTRIVALGLTALLVMSVCELVGLLATLYAGRSLMDNSIYFSWGCITLGPLVLLCSCCLFHYVLQTCMRLWKQHRNGVLVELP